jgi:hypothetical protein
MLRGPRRKDVGDDDGAIGPRSLALCPTTFIFAQAATYRRRGSEHLSASVLPTTKPLCAPGGVATPFVRTLSQPPIRTPHVRPEIIQGPDAHS